jgi:hypothetical protein
MSKLNVLLLHPLEHHVVDVQQSFGSSELKKAVAQYLECSPSKISVYLVRSHSFREYELINDLGSIEY